MKDLFSSLHLRKRPEDVAQMILEQLEDLDKNEEKVLQCAAKGSLKRLMLGYTSMLEQFSKPVGLQRQVAVSTHIFKSAYLLTKDQCDDPEAVKKYICTIGQDIQKVFGKSDFKSDRLDHNAREANGIEISRRRYNKLFRHLIRMEQKLNKLTRELRKIEFQKTGKSGLATKLSWEEFSKNLNSACFIAYYTARCNLRSEFTIYGQQRPYDEIAHMLFERCGRDSNTNWWAIAHVYPDQKVLQYLTDQQKGELLGMWFTILKDAADLLEEVWSQSNINLKTMIVRRGNDSSTWNNTAGAWNKARDNWIALLYTMGMEDMLEFICFGKVLRLMAADVAWWHRMSGGTLDPNTHVWNELPLPWEVLSGKAVCTKSMVEEICHKHNVDPEKTGWTAPRPRNNVARYRLTPELVHGVTVSNPYLATLLKRAGYFSGKKVNIYPGSQGNAYKNN
jgi:hypothetical protein